MSVRREACHVAVFLFVTFFFACAGHTPAAAPVATAPAMATAKPGPAATASSAEPVAAAKGVSPEASASSRPPLLTGQPLPLPGATGPSFLDYIAYEPANARVWVPVGITGSVDVLDVGHGTFQRIDGFKTEVRDTKGNKRTYGPSAAAVGDGFVYIGNRATNEICPIDVRTLKAKKCIKLDDATDGVAYVASAKEVWVTNPKAQTLTVLDAKAPDTLRPKATVKTDGSPEGYAVDDGGGIFFTNLEDKGSTLAIDIKTRKVKETWNAHCGDDGPRGVAFDSLHDFVIVACTDHLQVLDAARGGASLGGMDTGAGVDNIDFTAGKIVVAAGKAERVTVATLSDKGQFTVVATGATSAGARNAVSDANGNIYVADSREARLLVFGAASSK